MATYNSGSYISTDNGKFRLEVVVDVSSAGLKLTPRIHISDAFKSSHTFELTYYANNKTKKTVKKSKSGATKYKSSGTHNFASFTIKDYVVSKAISLKLNGKTATIKANTIKSTLKPPSPSAIYFKLNQPTIWEIHVEGSGEEEQPVNKIYLEYTNIKNPQDGDWQSMNYDSFGYHPSSSNEKAYHSIFRQEIELNQFYKFRARASGSRTGTEIFSSWIVSPDFVSKPEETSDVSIDAEDHKITWTADLNDIDKGIVTDWRIYRAIDDGEFSIIATVQAVAGKRYYEWVDDSQLVGHRYRYKIVGHNAGGQSWDTSETEVEIEGVPYAPSTGDVNYYYNEDGSVVIVVDLADGVETTYIEKSEDGGSTWAQIATLDAPENMYIDNSATSNSIYRVRFGNSSGESDYSSSFQPAATIEPNPPSILLPVYHSNLPIADGFVDIYWQHNSLDGSPQKSAEIKILDKEGTVLLDETLVTSAQQYRWNSSLASPTVVNVQIRTQGANGLWSDFNNTQFFLVREPQIIINSPSGTLTNLPIEVSFTYRTSGLDTGIDLYNSYLKEITIEVIDEEGDTFYKKTVEYNRETTEQFTDTISLMDALFSSNIEYSLQISAKETNGLTANHSTLFVINYDDEVLAGSLTPIVSNDEENGYVYISIGRDIGDDGEQEPAPVVKAYLYRNAQSERVFLGEVEENLQITDKLAPINKDITYDLLQLYENGTASLITIDAYNPSRYSYIYWGNRLDKIAKAQWNPTQSTSMSRPERTLVRYSGRKYPVVYDSKAREETANFTAVLEPEELDDFISIMNSGGTGIWKSVQGRAFNASFDLDFQRVDTNYNIELYEATLSVERVED